MDYEELLKRAKEKIPKDVLEKKRFEMPKAESFIQGSKTIITNIGHIANYLNRDINHILKFLSRELATAGLIESSRAVFTGKFTNNQVNAKVELYVKEFVTCRECGSPDTKLFKEERVDCMKCMACQASRPVATIK